MRRTLGVCSATSNQVIAQLDQHVVPTYGRFALALSHGEGMYVWDCAGNKFLDMGGGIAVNSLGHSHPAIVDALAQQSKKLMHISNLYYNEEQGKLAQNIIAHMHPGKVFMCNSGAEANEGLFKFARLRGNDSERYGIITALNSFHGRTLAAISATGQEKIKAGFGPQHAHFTHVPFNDLAATEAAIKEDTIAIHIEGVQGESGIVPATPDYLLGLRQLCDERDLLLTMDSVQCGHFRTGRFQSYMRILEGITGGEAFVPDAVSMAKSLGGGFPIGAFWVCEKYQDLLQPGTHGTTFGGNPLACAVSNAIFDVIEREGLEDHVRQIGDFLIAELRRMQNDMPGIIHEVRGLGCMIGLELADRPELYAVEDGTAAGQMINRLHAHGMLAVGAGTHTIRLLPPFNITMEEAEEACGIFESCLKEVQEK